MAPWPSEINHSSLVETMKKRLDFLLDLFWTRGPILRLHLRNDLGKRAPAVALPQDFRACSLQTQDALG
jgi:hypothetical protein